MSRPDRVKQIHFHLQANESFSRKNVVRGMHFQWAPYMGKLIRVVHGRMLSLVLPRPPQTRNPTP
jgi:dTDP-4-dehydrorhamnose 3,5-epimerase-like enzyme